MYCPQFIPFIVSGFFFQAEDGIRDLLVTGFRRVLFRSFTGWSSERCPGIGFLSRGDREIGVLRNVEPPTRPRLEYLRETGLILRCDRKVGNPFQTKQGSRPSCPDQEGRKGSEEGVPENLSVPLEGDRDFGELCGSHQGCQVPFRPP